MASKNLDRKTTGDFQIAVSDKMGVYRNEGSGKYIQVIGLTNNHVDKYDSKIYLFRSTKKLDPDNLDTKDVDLVKKDFTLAADAEKDFLTKLPKSEWGGARDQKGTDKAFDSMSRADGETFAQIYHTYTQSQSFGYITTLIHEGVHALHRDNDEYSAYKAEIKSYKQCHEK